MEVPSRWRTQQARSKPNTRFDPFGNTTSSGATSSNAFQFTGRENDGTGLYYYRARYHAPTQARFTSEDPIGFYGGMNLYTYVEDSPTNLVDPFGTQARPMPTPRPVPMPMPRPMPGPGPIVIAPWAPIVLFDVWIWQHNWEQFQKLCLASGWGWCSPSASSSLPMPSSDPLTDPACEKQRCKAVRQWCIQEECDDAIPTPDHGKRFFWCLDRCLKKFNCPGLP